MRNWLIKKLGGVPTLQAFEWEAEAEAKAHEYHKGKIAFYEKYTKQLSHENDTLRIVIREICRRSETGYYDWCCEYCKAECDKRNGWCTRFCV